MKINSKEMFDAKIRGNRFGRWINDTLKLVERNMDMDYKNSRPNDDKKNNEEDKI